jgi:hypothetical protein
VALSFLDLHELSELGRPGSLPLPDRLGVGVEQAENLVGMMGVALEDARPSLGL